MLNNTDKYLTLFNNSNYLISFDIARILAMLLILFLHIESGFNDYTGNSFDNFIYIGPLGVPIFFFISGFLIFKSLSDKPNLNFFNFLYKRLLRLIPLYYSLLFIYILCILLFSGALNNYQEINLSKIITSLFFGFGRMDKTYLSASWALWPEFAFYSFTALFLIKGPEDNIKKLFTGLTFIGASQIFPGGGFLGTYGAWGIEAIKPWSKDASSIGILLTCFGNLTCVFGISFCLKVLKNFLNLIFKNNKYFLKRDNISILITFVLSSYFYSEGSYYFYFVAGAMLFICFKTKNLSILLIHISLLGIISLLSLKNDLNSLMIYFIFLFVPILEKLIVNFNSILKKIIKLFSKISYTIYLTQIFTIPIYFKIASFLWKENLIYWNNLINCFIFTIISAYIVWNILEKPFNKIFFRKN